MMQVKYLVYVLRNLSLMLCVGALLVACFNNKPTSKKRRKKSTATGLPYNKKGGFQVSKFKGQQVGPNLVFIEGGSVVMGGFTEELVHTGYTPKRKVTVLSFYMDEAVVTNVNWREYLYYLQRDSTEEEYKAALPDTTAWVRELAYNDPLVQYYLKSPGFDDYPVVGVSWVQAKGYCQWRTAVANKSLSKKAGKAYKKGEGEDLPIESGYVLPEYRLPSEAEWEYAAMAMVGTQSLDFLQSNQRTYPWDGSSLRRTSKKDKGQFLANFKRGRGNYKGLPGESDSDAPTSNVRAHPPNDFGLYGMAGNVNEWVEDTYRPLSFGDEDFNPIRRDGTGDPASDYDPKHSLVNDRAKVYKGGSWKDVSYWLTPGARRYLDQDSSTATIGFRCAMTSIGK